MLCIYRLGEYAIRVLSCTCRALSRSIGIEERRIAARPLMQLVVYDGPIVIDEPPATPSFSCQHRPCCADRQAHVQLIRVNAARRQEVWREKQRKEALPRALPPPPLASRVPRSSGVGRGTKMPAARQVCCVRHVLSCDIVPALLSRLSGGHVANECKRRSAWSSVGRPTAKECHTPVAAKEKSHVWTRIRLSVKMHMLFPSCPLPPLPVPPQCQGVTLAGQPCQVTSRQLHVHAASLRCGSSFCQHHQPDKFTGIQCAGVTKHGARCRVFSGSTYANAAPLRDGKQFCRSHATTYVRCAGTTKGDAWCCVSSRSVHAGADPLREGGVFCAKHALPPAEHCASCGETDTELWPDEDTEPQYFKQFHSYERLHYCAACWDGWSE